MIKTAIKPASFTKLKENLVTWLLGGGVSHLNGSAWKARDRRFARTQPILTHAKVATIGSSSLFSNSHGIYLSNYQW